MSDNRRGRDSDKSELELARETNSRVKRIETRVTSLMIGLGMDAPAQRPEFVPATDGAPAHVKIPSPHCSIKQIVDSLPETCDGTVGILMGSDQIATLDVSRTQL